MTTPSNEIVITESAMQKVLANDETLRLKCIVETLYEQINQLSLKQLKTINKILDGKFKTEKQKMKEVKKSFPNIINGSGVIIND